MEDRYFIVKKRQKYIVRWACTFVKTDIEYDDDTNHLVVSMENNFNAPWLNGCKLEEINIKHFFSTERDAELEILRIERFGE